MSREKVNFIVGLAIGVVLTGIFLLYFAPRFVTVKSGDYLVKQDKWTGNSWRFVNNEWRKIISTERDWEKIDQNLLEALNISPIDVDRKFILGLLKEKYPLLKDLPDEDLLERINIVYSKQILVNLYLGNFLKVHKESAPKDY